MNTKITAFGKVVRQLRIETDVRMVTMADDIGVSISYLSAVETGRRKLTNEFVEKVANYFKNKGLSTSQIYTSAEQTMDEIIINVKDSDQTSREVVAAFARKFPDFSKEEKETFLNLLK